MANEPADKPCVKCHGAGSYSYDENHGKVCEVCCPHDQGWWLLKTHYGEDNGNYACKRGCGEKRTPEELGVHVPEFITTEPADRLEPADVDGLVERLKSSAKAFRENTVYTQDGDAVRLGVQADECDEAATAIRSLQARCAELEACIRWYADQMCEGWCDKDPKACEAIGPDNCAGCPARQALTKEPE